MKKLLFVLALMFVVGNAFAQEAVVLTSATTSSQFVLATRIIGSATVTTVAPFASSLASSAQSRGVAGVEQMKDELVGLNDDMLAGNVRTIEEVRQPALKEFFSEISEDEEQMSNINSVIESGSELERIATAVTISLLAE